MRVHPNLPFYILWLTVGCLKAVHLVVSWKLARSNSQTYNYATSGRSLFTLIKSPLLLAELFGELGLEVLSVALVYSQKPAHGWHRKSYRPK